MKIYEIYDKVDYNATNENKIICTIKDFEEKHLNSFNTVEDIIVKGNIQSDNFLRFIIKHFNPNKNFLSHIFVFKPKNVLTYLPNFCVTDCVLNQYPDLNTRIKITDNAIDFYNKYINYEMPVVNFLSHSGHYSIKNKTACDALLLKEHYTHNSKAIATDLQLDTALDYKLQKNKNPNSEINIADIIVANDINEGNSIMKSFLINNQYNIYGYVLGTTAKVILNSRSNLYDNEGAVNFISIKK